MHTHLQYGVREHYPSRLFRKFLDCGQVSKNTQLREGRPKKLTPRMQQFLKDFAQDQGHKFTYQEAADNINAQLENAGSGERISEVTVRRFILNPLNGWKVQNGKKQKLQTT